MNTQTSHDIQKIFDWIVKYKREHDGNSPSLREMMRACGIVSTSTMTSRIDEMEAQGLIALAGRGKSRCIVVIGGEWRFTGD
jgi:SOS-response transcriptional repressor LexA